MPAPFDLQRFPVIPGKLNANYMNLRDKLIWALLVMEAIAFIASFIFFKRLKREGLIFITVLMSVIMLTEIIGKLISEGIITFIKSSFWFNVMVPLTFLSLFVLFYQNTASLFWRRAIAVFMGITILFAVYLLVQGTKRFDTLNYTITAAFVCACCLHYLYECMNSRYITGIYKNALFYLAIGTLLFYLGTLPLRSMYNYLFAHYQSVFYRYYMLSFFLNYIMYGLIIFGIVWAKKK